MPQQVFELSKLKSHMRGCCCCCCWVFIRLLELPVPDSDGGLLAGYMAPPVLGDQRPVLLDHHQGRDTGYA